MQKKNNRAIALIIKQKTFSKVKKNFEKVNKASILRKDLISSLLNNIKKNSKIISSVGYNSRELYQIRSEKKFKNGKDFLMIGAMGHTLSVSLAISKYNNNEVICLDGELPSFGFVSSTKFRGTL